MRAAESAPKGKRPAREPEDPLAGVSYGCPEDGDLDWRKDKFDDSTPDDDEELPETPADVISLLGFDPLEE